MNIIVDLNTPITDGKEVVFRSPVDCSQVTGLIVNYNDVSQEFAFADAHGNNVGDIDHLFAENVVVKVILDVTTSMAFVQNADTNAYLEGRFESLEDMIGSGGSTATQKSLELSDFVLNVNADITEVADVFKVARSISTGSYSWCSLSPAITAVEFEIKDTMFLCLGSTKDSCTVLYLTTAYPGRLFENTSTKYTQLSSHNNADAPKAGDKCRVKFLPNNVVVVEVKRSWDTGYVLWQEYNMDDYPNATAYFESRCFGFLATKTYSPTVYKCVIAENCDIVPKMTWCSFGDSITQYNKWQWYIERKVNNIEHINCGLGSTSLAEAGMSRPALCKDERLGLGDYSEVKSSTVDGETYNLVIPNNPDIVTIMGGANDVKYGKGLGTSEEFEKALAVKDTTTFYGAYSYIIEQLLTWKPTLRIILITTHNAHFENPDFCTAGYNYKDLADAVKEIGAYYSVPVVDVNSECGINKLTAEKYLSDTVHPNERGGKLIAERVIPEFNKIIY